MTEQNTSSGSVATVYEGPQGEHLSIRFRALGEAGVLSVNTEDAVVEKITVNRWDASLITTDHFPKVIPFPEKTQILSVSFLAGKTLPEKEVFPQIIEGISLYG